MDSRQRYLAPKLKLDKKLGFDTEKTSEKKEHKEDTVFLKQVTMTLNLKKWTREFFLLLMRTILSIPFFLMQNCTLTTIKSTFRTDFILTNLTFLTVSKVHCQITRESCIVKGMTIKKFQSISPKVHFSLEERNCTVDLTL